MNLNNEFTDNCLSFNPRNQEKELQYTKENELSSSNMYALYVGDLNENTTERDLYEILSKYRTIHSLRICYDLFTGKSLGYGYINFNRREDAEYILQQLNFYSDNNLFRRPLRLMWKKKNNKLRKSGLGNIFIKNLPMFFNSKSLFETFSFFGKIVSCKVIFDEEGRSMKYGFVHFKNYFNSVRAKKKTRRVSSIGSKFIRKFFFKEKKKNWPVQREIQIYQHFYKKYRNRKLYRILY